MSGLLLAGNVYVKRLDDVSATVIGPIETDKLSIQGKSEAKTRTSKKKDSYGQLVGAVYINQPPEVAISFVDQPAALLGLALMGNSVPVNQAAVTITALEVTLPTDNSWAAIGNKNLGAMTVVKASDDSALVVGTDVEINYVLGLIRALPTGGLATGGGVKVTGSALAVTGTRVQGGTVANVRLQVMFDGKNLETGEAVQMEIPEAILTPSGAVDFLSADFITTELTGQIKLVDGHVAPFTYDVVTTA